MKTNGKCRFIICLFTLMMLFVSLIAMSPKLLLQLVQK